MKLHSKDAVGKSSAPNVLLTTELGALLFLFAMFVPTLYRVLSCLLTIVSG